MSGGWGEGGGGVGPVGSGGVEGEGGAGGSEEEEEGGGEEEHGGYCCVEGGVWRGIGVEVIEGKSEGEAELAGPISKGCVL